MAKSGGKKLVQGTTRPSWFTPVVVISLLAGAAGLFVGYGALTRPQPDPTTGYAGIAAAGAAVVLAALLAALTKRYLEVGTRGIEAQQGLGQPVEIAWAEPHDYYYLAVSGASTPTVDAASVRTPDGRRIDVYDVELADHPNARLPALVEQYSTAANLPKIRARLEEGEDVAFGAITLGPNRIEAGDVSQPLDDGVILQIDKGRIRVGSGGSWQATNVSVRDVANYPCLLRVIGQISQALPPS